MIICVGAIGIISMNLLPARGRYNWCALSLMACMAYQNKIVKFLVQKSRKSIVCNWSPIDLKLVVSPVWLGYNLFSQDISKSFNHHCDLSEVELAPWWCCGAKWGTSTSTPVLGLGGHPDPGRQQVCPHCWKKIAPTILVEAGFSYSHVDCLL